MTRLSDDARFWAKVDQSDACWHWRGYTSGQGYGRFWYGGRLGQAHRWAYEQTNGPIPAGLTIDHLCRIRNCVRPDHMEAVSSAENTKRGKAGLFQASRTHCPQGHAYTEENIYRPPSKPATRMCRACMRQRQALTRRWKYGPTHYVNGNQDKTACLRGHPFTVENAHVRANGSRRCRQCQRDMRAAGRWKK